MYSLNGYDSNKVNSADELLLENEIKNKNYKKRQTEKRNDTNMALLSELKEIKSILKYIVNKL